MEWMVFPVVAISFAAAPPVNAEASAIAYLVREVPRWHRENHCYSCHHNADAARALYRAVELGYRIPKAALDDTTRWLERPTGWDKNGGEGEFSDKKLARLQFAMTLIAAIDDSPKARIEAAQLVADLQDGDGSWRIVPEGTLGGATTLGTALATEFARRTLEKVDPKRYQTAIAKARRWQAKAPLNSILDAAAVLLSGSAQRDRALALLRRAEASKGGWGPFVNASPEVFDTAMVVLALVEQPQTAEVKAWIRRGRAFLLSQQQPDGGWIETTRPAGGDSLSQRLSTAGWATLALLESRRIISR